MNSMRAKLMSLKKHRDKIDSLDERIIKLLNQRAKHSQAIGAYKKENNQLVYAPDREKKLLKRLKSLNAGPIKNSSIESIYREIMSSSLSLEKALRIAYLGPEMTFSHQASVKHFGRSVSHIPCKTITDIFADVENGRSDYGIVPVENSTEGAIYFTLDSFAQSDLKICAEIIMQIDLSLLSKDKELSKIKAVYSNPQVFGQCRQWLESHLPGVPFMSEASTAKSALITTQKKNSACISSALIAEKHSLNILASAIQDNSNNVTRFLVLAKEAALPTGDDKTSIVISIKDKAGALTRVLSAFEKRKVNLSKIESRPSKKGHWDYLFFIDFDAHSHEKKAVEALAELERDCEVLKVMGSYPKSSLR
ncbi:MAG: chorismate mutase/prephenate dehydratase [Candidatus Omnitrophota bacterium]|jgi:chorismate mutase/prephenate dehydratase